MDETEKIYIEDLTAQGSGVGRGADGAAVFVRGALPGDTVTAECVKKKKKYREDAIVSIEEPSEDRVLSFCGAAETFAGGHKEGCGGCPYAELSYAAQTRQKRKQIIADLTRIGGIEDPVVKDTIVMDEPYAYRNKVTLQVAWQGGDEWQEGSVPAVGFYRSGSHDVTDCPFCRVQAAPVTAIAASLRTFMMQNHISAFDKKKKQGVIKDVIVRTCFATGEVMVIVEINEPNIPEAHKLVDMMDAQVKRLDMDSGAVWSLESFYVAAPGRKPLLIAGKPTVEEDLAGVKYEISPLSFYQVNPVQTVKLYDKVFEYAGLSAGDTLLDLYCGVGSIGLYLTKKMEGAVSVLGVESVKSAVLDANRNAVINGIVDARYLCGPAEMVLPELREIADGSDEEDIESGSDVDYAVRALRNAKTAIVDPPRSGCNEKLLDALSGLGIERLVYVSCDPATLARDVKRLRENGFDLVEATPVDMFPHTGHVECVVLMSKAST